MRENNINEILKKFCKKLFGSFDWIILHKIFMSLNLLNIEEKF